MAGSRTIGLVARARKHLGRVAICDDDGERSYDDLLDASARAAAALLDGAPSLCGERVAFLIPPGFSHVAVEWGIWRAGGIAVPLAAAQPRRELQHILADSGAKLVVGDAGHEAVLRPLAGELRRRFLPVAELAAASPAAPLSEVDAAERAMIVYTSGTTSRPKGVVSTHENIRAQIESLVSAWEWRADDRILHVLPLNHIHGIINVLGCALWAGAACEMLPRFEARAVWRRFAGGRLTLFMAVPTIYAKLIKAWEEASPGERESWSQGARAMRLMVSGSAALPVRVVERWREITGQLLLERYGMTEIGMALSNPLRGERRAGAVGTPLPGVDVRLVDESGAPVADGTPGEIRVRGPGVFREYWGRPETTREAFEGGWFRTGDIAVVDGGAYRILGRASVDIIKSGGYKISALEVEEVLREHPAIEACAVVGVPDEEWGERVAAALVVKGNARLDLEALRAWARTRLASYKLPSRCLELRELPHNALGKVLKPQIAKLFSTAPPADSAAAFRLPS